MSKRNQYANWCDICRKPFAKDASHQHCPKCNAAPQAIIVCESEANRWGLDVWNHTCQVCKHTWTEGR